MSYKRKSRRYRQKKNRRKTAKGNWRWSYYRGLYKKSPKKTPKKNTIRRLRRYTLREESPITPDEYYNQYLNPNRY